MDKDCTMQLEAIGTFQCDARYPYDAARQPGHAHESIGSITLHAHRHYEQALQDLAGFSRIWLIYQFHHNEHWKPMVSPPRAARKVGLFASRAPYRPNPIGLSCVELLAVSGLRVEVGAHDLLDGTPILDIKPYLPYADSFPESRTGWLEALGTQRWTILYSDAVEAQLAWLEANSALRLHAFLLQQLSELPFDMRRKRIRNLGEDTWEIAYRTWRARYAADSETCALRIEAIYSGYSPEDRMDSIDPYEDKALHREYNEVFPPLG